MERGGHGYRKLSSSGGSSGSEHNNGLSDTSNNNNNNNHHASSDDSNECIVREQDRFMPIANVIRIMRRILPPHAKISDDAKETIQECVSEYISFITGEANERCQREQRKTITAEDVLWAMNKLGFDDYIEPLTLYLHRYRELEGDRGGSLRGVGEASLMLKRSAMEYGATPLSFSPRGFHVGHHGGFMSGGSNGPSSGMGGCFKEANGDGDGSSHAKCK